MEIFHLPCHALNKHTAFSGLGCDVFLCSQTGPTPNSFNLYRGGGRCLSVEVKRPGREADHSALAVQLLTVHTGNLFAFISSAFNTYGTVVVMCTRRCNVQNFAFGDEVC